MDSAHAAPNRLQPIGKGGVRHRHGCCYVMLHACMACIARPEIEERAERRRRREGSTYVPVRVRTFLRTGTSTWPTGALSGCRHNLLLIYRYSK